MALDVSLNPSVLQHPHFSRKESRVVSIKDIFLGKTFTEFMIIRFRNSFYFKFFVEETEPMSKASRKTV